MAGSSIRLNPSALKFLFSPLVFIFLSIQISFSQTRNSEDSVNRKKMGALIITTASVYSATMIGLNEVWYSSFDRQSFAFFNDSKEWLQVDKAGHLYSAFQLSDLSARALQATGVSKRKSYKIGAISSFIMMSSIEVFDGFSAGYGASVSDLAANAIGSSLSLGQELLWDEIRIQPKFSFHETYLANQRPSILGSNLGQQLIKDYNGQTYWLSVDMDKFTSFPKWLNWAVGYGGHDMVYAAKNANSNNGYSSYRQFYLSLDFDLTAIKTKSKGLRTFLYFVNMIKLPAPTLEFSNRGVKTYAFYF